MGKQEHELFEAFKGFLTLDGEFEYDPSMLTPDTALCLDFIDYLKASDWIVASPRIRNRIVKWIFRTDAAD